MILLQNVPQGYEDCFAGAGKYPKASTFLCAIAVRLLSESEEPRLQMVHAVNPFYVGRLFNFSVCACYRSNELLQYARGMTRLLMKCP